MSTQLIVPDSRSGFNLAHFARTTVPGIVLCIGVTLVAFALQMVEERIFGRAWLEALLLSILIGTAIRSFYKPGPRMDAGIEFSAKTLLEVAVVFLGATLSAQTLGAAGASLLLGIATVVVVAVIVSYTIGRVLGLHHSMALLVACGNSICGNSAIAAVAPVINAHRDDVAASIAFTAVLGVIVVLGLPAMATLFHLSHLQYGTLAGLTVYAVPQVLAATVPVSAVSAQLGTLVKLVRVLMLGPVMMVLSLIKQTQKNSMDSAPGKQISWHNMLPWFIIGFLLMCIARSANLIPHTFVEPIGKMASLLTIVSMAALGLGVDVRTVAKAGPRVTLAVILSILALAGISLVLIHILAIP